MDDGSMDYANSEYSYKYATHIGGAGAPEDPHIIPERRWAAMPQQPRVFGWFNRPQNLRNCASLEVREKDQGQAYR
jgi:hypothetical protein